MLKESEKLEFKENFSRKVVETVVAFANTGGGTVLVGVDDKGRPAGVSVGRETLNQWSNEIAVNTEPTVIPEIQTDELEGKAIVRIAVQEYPLKPVSTRGRCFRRVGSSNKQMTPPEIAQMHLASTGSSWDALPAANKTLDDIDPAQVEKYISLANATGRRRFEPDAGPLDVLRKLELIVDDQPTWAAILLFGREPQSPLIQATVHCGRFREEVNIMDDRLISGSIIHQVEEAMDFIKKHINVQFVITGKPRRDEVWDYPLKALREAVINAVCHRDYSDSADIQIKVHDNRLQIWSPGGLPFDVTVEDLMSPTHGSKPRNKLIAQVFYDIELIERYGSGIGRILAGCRAAELPVPEFGNVSGGFSVNFIRAQSEAQSEAQSGAESEAESGAQSGAESGRGLATADTVTPQQNKIISILAGRELSAAEIAQELGKTGKSGAVKRNLKILLGQNLIEYTIPEKPNSRLQRYRLKKK